MRWPHFVHDLLAGGARAGNAGRRPQILGATPFLQEDGRFRFQVTLQHVPNVFCDALDVLSPDGRVLGRCPLLEQGNAIREPIHELADVAVEQEIGFVFLRVRRRERGYDGQRFRVELPRGPRAR